MRTQVADVNRSPSHRSPQVRQAGANYEPVFQTQVPPVRRSSAKSTPPARAKLRIPLAPTEGWLAMLLLAIALYSVVASIIAAQWVKPGMLLIWSPTIGLLVGFTISKIPRLPQAVLHLTACLIGHWLSVWMTSALAYHVSWTIILAGLRAAFTGTLTPGMTPTSDMIFFFYLCFLCFFLGYFGSWLVYRAHLPWLVVLVYSSIMLVNLNYVKNGTFAILLLVAAMAGALALLIARLQIITQVAQWKSEGLHTDKSWLRGITWRCMQVAVAITLITMLVAIAAPAPDNQPPSGRVFWDRLDNAWTNISNGHASLQDLGALTSPYQPSSNYFGDQLTITGSVSLPMGEVLDYSDPNGPEYLEGFTYNHFDGHTWTTSVTGDQNSRYTPNAPLPLDAGREMSQPVTTYVTLVQPPQGTKAYIFGPAQPVSFDVPTIVYADGTASSWAQQTPLKVGQHYLVTSVAPMNDEKTLSSMLLPHQDPMAWQQDDYYSKMSPEYLQLPNDLSPHVKQLESQWTKGATSAYGALKMLESHLSNQSEFTYSVSNPAIPSNTDVVDWLLQTKRGYCTSYASAMAVMARQLGIPTRMSNGFSNGQFDPQRKLWVVAGSDAHSWVQAYFPGYGWINFDPTPGYAPGAAPTKQQAMQAAAKATPPATTKNAAQPKPQPTKAAQPTKPDMRSVSAGATLHADGINSGILLALAIGVFVLSLLLFLFALGRYWWRNLYAHSSLVAGAYWRFCHVASWLGLGPRQWQTPYEYSYMLSKQLPHQASPLRHLTELFVRDRYAAPHQARRPHDEETVERLWPTLRALLFQLFMKKVNMKPDKSE